MKNIILLFNLLLLSQCMVTGQSEDATHEEVKKAGMQKEETKKAGIQKDEIINCENSIEMQIGGKAKLKLVKNPTNSMTLEVLNNQRNIFIGGGVGVKNSTGTLNTFIGDITGINNTTGSQNTFIGYRVGNVVTKQNSNTFVGALSGAKLYTGNSNSIFGASAGSHINHGDNNVFLGYAAGGLTSKGSGNVYIGSQAGMNNMVGSNNTLIGHFAGRSMKGNGNVFIGSLTGNADSVDNKLIIDNSNSSTPLIYGDFDTELVRVNGKKGLEVSHNSNLSEDGFKLENSIGDKKHWRFHVNDKSGELMLFSKANKSNVSIGTFNPTTGAYTSLSDIRYKTGIEPLAQVLPSLLLLKPKKYHFNGQMEVEEKSLGFLAQEVKDIFPELVRHSEADDIYQLNYASLNVLLVKALQEQQELIETQQSEIESLKSLTERLANRITALEQKEANKK